MASRKQKAISSTVAGAGLGTAILPGIGTAIGGALGGLAGLFSKSDPEVNVPLFSDVSLQRDNPELYNQILRNDAMIQKANDIMKARMKGPTEGERYQEQANLSDLQGRLGGANLLGSGLGFSLYENAQRRMQADQADRIQRDALGQAQLLQQAEAQRGQLIRGGLQDAYNAKLGVAQNDQANLEASNGFYGNLLMGGLQAGVGGLLYGGSPRGSSSGSWYGSLFGPESAPYINPTDRSYSLGANTNLLGSPQYPLYSRNF